MGSFSVDYQNILGYFEYSQPLFELHLETNFFGFIITRNNIGQFRLLSAGHRKGLMIEFKTGTKNIEKIFITPKDQLNFISKLEEILKLNFGSKFEL